MVKIVEIDITVIGFIGMAFISFIVGMFIKGRKKTEVKPNFYAIPPSPITNIPNHPQYKIVDRELVEYMIKGIKRIEEKIDANHSKFMSYIEPLMKGKTAENMERMKELKDLRSNMDRINEVMDVSNLEKDEEEGDAIENE